MTLQQPATPYKTPVLSILAFILLTVTATLPAPAPAACLENATPRTGGPYTRCGDKSQLGFEGNSNLMRIGPGSGTCNLVRRYPTPAGSNYAWEITPGSALTYLTVINLKNSAGFTNFRTKMEGRNLIKTCYLDLAPDCLDEHGDPVANPTDWSDCDSIDPRSGNTCPLSYYSPAFYEACISGTSAPSTTPECNHAPGQQFKCRVGLPFSTSSSSITIRGNKFEYEWACGTRLGDGRIGAPFKNCNAIGEPNPQYNYIDPKCDETKRYGCTPATTSITSPSDNPNAEINYYHRQGADHVEGAEAVHKVKDEVKGEYRWKCLMYHGTAPGRYSNPRTTLPGNPAKVSTDGSGTGGVCTIEIEGPQCDNTVLYGCDVGTVQESSKNRIGAPPDQKDTWYCEDTVGGVTKTSQQRCEKPVGEVTDKAECPDYRDENGRYDWTKKDQCKYGEKGYSDNTSCYNYKWRCVSIDGTETDYCGITRQNACGPTEKSCAMEYDWCNPDIDGIVKNNPTDYQPNIDTGEVDGEGNAIHKNLWNCRGGNANSEADDAMNCEKIITVQPPDPKPGVCDYSTQGTAKCNDPITPTAINTETYRMSWTCAGTGGGSTSHCEVVDGKCDLSTLNACTSGNPADHEDGDDTWNCIGINGGANDEGCTEPIEPRPDEICGSNDNIDDGCADANYDWVNVDGPSWQCKHSVSGVIKDCGDTESDPVCETVKFCEPDHDSRPGGQICHDIPPDSSECCGPANTFTCISGDYSAGDEYGHWKCGDADCGTTLCEWGEWQPDESQFCETEDVEQRSYYSCAGRTNLPKIRTVKGTKECSG